MTQKINVQYMTMIVHKWTAVFCVVLRVVGVSQQLNPLLAGYQLIAYF